MLEINLKQLESFVATVEHSGFTAAAAALYLTQSTVSAHVSALEQTLGVPLLVRGARRPVTLTPEGQNVYVQAREILNRCERLQALGPAEQPPLRLGASTAPGQGLLPELLTGFLQRCPDSRYVLLRGDSARIHSLMLESRVHLGFVGAAMDPRRFVYHPIANDRLVLIAPNREPYPTLRRQGVSGLTLLTQQPLIRREPASGTRQSLEDYLRRSGIAADCLHSVAEIDTPEDVKAAVQRGLGVAVISALAVQEELAAGKLLSFDLDRSGVFRRIYLAWPGWPPHGRRAPLCGLCALPRRIRVIRDDICRGEACLARRCTGDPYRLALKWYAPIASVAARAILTAAGTKRHCLPEIATGAKRPRNDKPLAISILTPACADRQPCAVPGCPLPYNA